MSDFKSIIDAIKRIETTLVEQFGAEGRGLHEKLSSVEERIPPNLQRSIRYLATVRNKAMHEDGYEVEDPVDYVRQATLVYTQLMGLPRKCEGTSAANPSAPIAGDDVACVTTPPNKLLVFAIGALIIGFFWYLAGDLQAKLDASKVQQEPVAEDIDVGKEDGTASPPPSKGQHKRDAELKAITSDRVLERKKGKSHVGAEPNQSASSALLTTSAVEASGLASATTAVRDLKNTVAAGKHAGMGNSALSVDDVQFSIKKGAWNVLTPQITLTVTNKSDKNVSNGRADAMLFLDGHDSPSVQANELYLYFGDRGLPVGESRSIQVSLDRKHEWKAPDVLNARKYVVAVRVISTDDGMARNFGGAAPALPWKVAPPKLKVLDGEPQDVDMRLKISTGDSVGAGNTAVRLGTPSIKFGSGAFGRDIEISVEVENVSNRTVSWIKADALLFINGEAEPAVGNQEVVSFYLGERGLAAGERRQVKGTIDHFKTHYWSVPDVLSAKSRLLALRVVKTDDGMRQAFGGTAKPFPWMMPR